jgi:sporulation protein YlmC with PRC-barrel domain
MVHAKLGDWRGKDVLDRDGEKIGKLEDVYVDTETDVEEFGTVKEGLISKHLTFVPLQEVTASPDSLRIPVAKSLVKDAPNLDTDDDLSAFDEESVYRHYGLTYTVPTTPSGRRLGRR